MHSEEDLQLPTADDLAIARHTTELVSYQSGAQSEDELAGEVKLSAADLIIQHLAELKEMIAFLDYSFERAFTMKEKLFIRDYKEHVLQIQGELDAIRTETFDKNLLEATK
jgi:hypothetical protein